MSRPRHPPSPHGRNPPVGLFVCAGAKLDTAEDDMNLLLRAIRCVAATVLALAVGSVASCGTMGGMRHLVTPPSVEQNASA